MLMLVSIDKLDPENMGLAIKILFCLIYMQSYKYFRFGGRHLEFMG